MGCGRVGARLATLLQGDGHEVLVLDMVAGAFSRLPGDFRGSTMVGNGIDTDTLRRAGIERADAFAACTQGDNRNIMASQIAKEHEVLVIEKDPKRVDLINSELGNVVFRGDAAEASTLAEVGAGRADLVCAVTGDDEDNLVISQLAKKRFAVNRAIARINNPKNEEIFRQLGIDSTVSTTEVILSILEQEIPSEAIVPLLRLRHADVEIV